MTIAIIIAAIGWVLATYALYRWAGETIAHSDTRILNALQQPRDSLGRFGPKRPSHTIKQEVR